MGSARDDLSELRSKIEVLERQIAIPRRGSGENPSSRKRRRKEERLKWEMDEFEITSLVTESRELLKAVSKWREEQENKTRRAKIFPMLGYFSRCFKTYVAIGMDLKWPDLDCALGEERERRTDGGWWGEPYHRELLGHLETLGFSKEQWECSLMFWTDNVDSYGCPPSCIGEVLRGYRRLLHSKEARHVLSPTQIETFEKIFKGVEEGDFFIV